MDSETLTTMDVFVMAKEMYRAVYTFIFQNKSISKLTISNMIYEKWKIMIDPPTIQYIFDSQGNPMSFLERSKR